MRVTVDQDRCCGSGLCVLTVPEVFGQSDDEGVVTLLRADPPETLREDVEEAASICPGRAIAVRS